MMLLIYTKGLCPSEPRPSWIARGNEGRGESPLVGQGFSLANFSRPKGLPYKDGENEGLPLILCISKTRMGYE